MAPTEQETDFVHSAHIARMPANNGTSIRRNIPVRGIQATRREQHSQLLSPGRQKIADSVRSDGNVGEDRLALKPSIYRTHTKNSTHTIRTVNAGPLAPVKRAHGAPPVPPPHRDRVVRVPVQCHSQREFRMRRADDTAVADPSSHAPLAPQ